MATVGAAPALCTGVAPAAAEASPSCCPASAAAFDAADLCRCCLCILLTDATMLHATAYSHCSRQLAHGGIAGLLQLEIDPAALRQMREEMVEEFQPACLCIMNLT